MFDIYRLVVSYFRTAIIDSMIPMPTWCCANVSAQHVGTRGYMYLCLETTKARPPMAGYRKKMLKSAASTLPAIPPAVDIYIYVYIFPRKNTYSFKYDDIHVEINNNNNQTF